MRVGRKGICVQGRDDARRGIATRQGQTRITPNGKREGRGGANWDRGTELLFWTPTIRAAVRADLGRKTLLKGLYRRERGGPTKEKDRD